jgi:hypothetical protein
MLGESEGEGQGGGQGVYYQGDGDDIDELRNKTESNCSAQTSQIRYLLTLEQCSVFNSAMGRLEMEE